MTKKIIERIGWAWLLAAPMLIMILGCWHVAAIGCDLEMHTVNPEMKASSYCLMVGYHRAATTEAVSLADISAINISQVSFMVATLFAAVATLIGYKAFIVDKRADRKADSLSCNLHTNGVGTPVSCEFAGEASRIGVADLKIVDNVGAVLQTMPNRDLSSGEVWRWTVLPEHASRPTALELRAVVTDSHGRVSDVSAIWHNVGSVFEPRSFNRVWR